jgi:type I restriction enzyme R subunit
MFVAIDKATAVRMHEKVGFAFRRLIAEDEAALRTAGEAEGAALIERLEWMRSLDMAVVVSQAQNEIADLEELGLDIRPHRARMLAEDLEAKFKDPDDPFRLVFVCAMWITGFDVPTIGTVYLDKPMKNHTLMQTIARANRRAAGKTSGVIVDYIGVFNNLQRALAIYAGGGAGGEGETPIQDKSALVAALDRELSAAQAFVGSFGVSAPAIAAASGFARLALIEAAVEALIAPDERRREFQRLTGAVVKAYKALLPDERAAPFLGPVAVLHVLDDAVKAKLGPADIKAISARIAALLDEKVEGVAILTPIVAGDRAEGRVDLSEIDFEKLATLFATKPKVATETLRGVAETQAKFMADANPTRLDLVEKLQEMVAAYNAGAIDPTTYFEWLKQFLAGLDDEEKRAAREGLSQDELAIFDLLTKPELKLTKSQEAEVKRVARELLENLRGLLDAVDWTSGRQSRAAVQSEIRVKLNELPEEPYPEDVWDTKVAAVWEFVLQRHG